MYQNIVVNLGESVRRESLEGRAHVVAPAAILREGVLDGSGGPVLYTDEDNAKSTLAWNHKPVVVYHPEENGRMVSAADPTILDARKVGILLRTNNHNKKVRAECWLDVERLKTVDSRILTSLEKGEKVEVSTGLDFDPEYKDGEYEGAAYKIIAHNYRPDHLAILPDRIGAFSVAQGGGLLAFNQAARQPESVQSVLARSALQAVRGLVGYDGKADVTLSDKGVWVVNGKELSFSEVSCQLSDLLAAEFGEPGKYWTGWIMETYPDRVIVYDGGKTWSVGYEVTGGAVSLSGSPVQVERVVEYREAGGRSYAANESGVLVEKREVEVVADKFDKKAHVAGLIGNGFEESDRAVLEGLADSVLQKIQPKPKETTPEVVAANAAGLEAKPITVNDLTDPGDREAVAEWKRTHEEQKQALVAKITANGRNKFTKEFLAKKPIDELRHMAELCAPAEPEEPEMFVNDYRGAAGGVSQPAPGPRGKPAADLPPMEEAQLTFNSVIPRS